MVIAWADFQKRLITAVQEDQPLDQILTFSRDLVAFSAKTRSHEGIDVRFYQQGVLYRQRRIDKKTKEEIVPKVPPVMQTLASFRGNTYTPLKRVICDIVEVTGNSAVGNLEYLSDWGCMWLFPPEVYNRHQNLTIEGILDAYRFGKFSFTTIDDVTKVCFSSDLNPARRYGNLEVTVSFDYLSQGGASSLQERLRILNGIYDVVKKIPNGRYK